MVELHGAVSLPSAHSSDRKAKKVIASAKDRPVKAAA